MSHANPWALEADPWEATRLPQAHEPRAPIAAQGAHTRPLCSSLAPWERDARALGVPPASGKAAGTFPFLRRMSPSRAVAPRRMRSRSREETRARPLPIRRPNPPAFLPTETAQGQGVGQTPTAIKGWRDEAHVVRAMAAVGLPPPHALQDHAAGIRRYKAAEVAIVNYYTNTGTVLVQGKKAGLFTVRMRTAQAATAQS